MGMFDKLFGKKQSGSAAGQGKPAETAKPAAAVAATSAAGQQGASADNPDMIRAMDNQGREVMMPRKQWLDTMLAPNLKKAWDNPDQLAAIIAHALNDRFYSEMVRPAERLREIDRNKERAAVILSIAYMESGRVDDADRVLQGFIRENGETGAIMTNVARVQEKRGNAAEAAATLWRSLERDPNQENGFGWYLAKEREKGGDAGFEEGLKKLAGLKGSWRAQLWQARGALVKKDLPAAMALYEQALANAPVPTPGDMLMQLSGDLGNQGHLNEIVQLLTPRFDPKVHGIQVGNNLIKANVDLGKVDEATALVESLHAMGRQDWRPMLNYWETEIGKRRQASAPPAPLTPDQPMEVAMLMFDGPVWADEELAAPELVPAHAGGSPRVCFLGSTAEMPQPQPGQQMGDGPGRLNRALPLFLAEHVHLLTQAQGRVVMPWIVRPRPGLILIGAPWKNEEAAAHTKAAADYVVITHVNATVDPWQVTMRLVRTADAVCVQEWSDAFNPTAPTDSLKDMGGALVQTLAQKAGIAKREGATAYGVPDGAWFAEYLLRLEQLLAARCANMEGVPQGYFTGEREAIDGALRLCVNHPKLATLRLLPMQLLSHLKDAKPQLVQEYAEKFQQLQRQFPLEGEAAEALERLTEKVLGGAQA